MTNDQNADARNRAITVRVPEPVYDMLRRHADEIGSSLNTVVAEAVAQYGARLRRSDAVARIEQRLKVYESANTSVGKVNAPDASADSMTGSAGDIRALRTSRSLGAEPSGTDRGTIL